MRGIDTTPAATAKAMIPRCSRREDNPTRHPGNRFTLAIFQTVRMQRGDVSENFICGDRAHHQNQSKSVAPHADRGDMLRAACTP
jgi:hypothetical protein